MMLRSVHLPLGFGVSPLLRCLPRFSGLASLPAVASCSWSRISASPEGLPLDVPYSRQHGVFRAFRMSSGGPGTSPDVDAALGSAVALPAIQMPKICFCHSCGNPTKQVIPNGEKKIRPVCVVCGKIHYQNPKMHIHPSVKAGAAITPNVQRMLMSYTCLSYVNGTNLPCWVPRLVTRLRMKRLSLRRT